MLEHADIPETKMFVVHEGGRLVHCNGADLIIYKGKEFTSRRFVPPAEAVYYPGHAMSADEVWQDYEDWMTRADKSPGVALWSSTSVAVRKGKLEIWSELRPT